MLIGLNAEEFAVYADLVDIGIDRTAAIVHIIAAVGAEIIDLDEPAEMPDHEEPVEVE